jgi:hypothetical protein
MPVDRSLLQSLNLPFASKFTDNFMDTGGTDTVDPFACVGRVDHETYCLGVRLWDILLFFAIMKRPRRDVALMEDFSSTLTEHLVSMLPVSIFPFDIVPANKVDSINNTQRVFDFGAKRTHGVIIRPHTTSIFSNNFKMECMGSQRSRVLEDEMYMTSLIMACDDVKCEVRDFPIDNWPIVLSVSWGTCYPFHRFPNALKWKQSEGPLSALAMSLEYSESISVLMHPSRHSVMVFTMDADSTKMLNNTSMEDLDNSSWIPRVRMVAEFATSTLNGKLIVHSVSAASPM